MFLNQPLIWKLQFPLPNPSGQGETFVPISHFNQTSLITSICMEPICKQAFKFFFTAAERQTCQAVEGTKGLCGSPNENAGIQQ